MYHAHRRLDGLKLWLPGALALCLIFLIVGLPLIILLQYLPQQNLVAVLSNSYIRHVIGFSFFQAALSTVISILWALLLALALARRNRFPGRRPLTTLFSLSLIIPTVTAVFGIVAVYGRTGWLTQIGATLNYEITFNLYGLTGILLAHVFFNMPLATRVILQLLISIPEDTWRLGAQLGMRERDVFKYIEWPAIRNQLPNLAILIFGLCFTSFAIVLTLGGGPAATTIEVAIYQAIRFDFNIPLAVTLALIQLVFCVLLLSIYVYWPSQPQGELTLGAARPSQRYFTDNAIYKLRDYVIIITAFLFVLAPLCALLIAGINPAMLGIISHASTLSAMLNTVTVAVISGLLSVGMGCLLLTTSVHLAVRLSYIRLARGIELVGLAILVVSPIVLGTGLFILLRPYADVFSLALVLVVIINALMGLPFVLRLLAKPIAASARNHDRLCLALGVRGWHRLAMVEWPVLRKPLGLSWALASALSAGDFTVIALFGSDRIQTLPLLLYQRMGSYRMQDAASTASILLIVCLLLFWLIERIVGGRDA